MSSEIQGVAENETYYGFVSIKTAYHKSSRQINSASLIWESFTTGAVLRELNQKFPTK